jgi:hypothetical protein
LFLRELVALAVYFGIENFGRVAVSFKDLLDVTDHLLVAFFEEDEDAGAGTAEAAAEEAGGAEFEDFFEAGDELLPVGLVEAVFECGWEGGDGAGGESSDEEG